jgi:aromatic-L-amino-acid/L-tryptophan decarboxylase
VRLHGSQVFAFRDSRIASIRVALDASDPVTAAYMARQALSICCFRYRPVGWNDEARLDALNEAILHGIRARGRTVTSSTRVDGRFAIRPCFINPRSTSADADALVDEVLAVGGDLAAAA